MTFSNFTIHVITVFQCDVLIIIILIINIVLLKIVHHIVDNYRQPDRILVQVSVNSFSSVNIATTGPLEATIEMSQVGTQPAECEHSNSRQSPGGSQVHSRCVPAECEPSLKYIRDQKYSILSTEVVK